MLPVLAAMLTVAWSGEAWLRPEEALSWADRIKGFLRLAPFVLGFGYFYLALIFTTPFILLRRGVIVPSHAI